MKRENEHKLVEDPGTAMNREFLAALNEAYDSVRKRYESCFPRFEVIDTSNEEGTTAGSTAFRVTSMILDLFDAREV